MSEAFKSWIANIQKQQEKNSKLHAIDNPFNKQKTTNIKASQDVTGQCVSEDTDFLRKDLKSAIDKLNTENIELVEKVKNLETENFRYRRILEAIGEL